MEDKWRTSGGQVDQHAQPPGRVSQSAHLLKNAVSNPETSRTKHLVMESIAAAAVNVASSAAPVVANVAPAAVDVAPADASKTRFTQVKEYVLQAAVNLGGECFTADDVTAFKEACKGQAFAQCDLVRKRLH